MILAASIAVCFDMMVWPARMFCGPRASVPPLAMMTLMKPAFCFSTSSLEVSSSISTISPTGRPVWTNWANAGTLKSRAATNTDVLFMKKSPRPQFADEGDFTSEFPLACWPVGLLACWPIFSGRASASGRPRHRSAGRSRRRDRCARRGSLPVSAADP